MKILIGIAGDPNQYKEVEYSFDSGITIKSKYSLFAIESYHKPDLNLCIIPETIARPVFEKIESDSDMAKKLTYGGYEKLVLEYFEEFKAKEIGGADANFKFMLLPNSGKFTINIDSKQRNIHAIGRVTDFKYVALYEIAKIILDKIPQLDSNAKIEIIYDSSTGLNILNLFVYSVLQVLLSIISAFYDSTLIIYSSLPKDVGKVYEVVEIEKVQRFDRSFHTKPNDFLPLKVNDRTDSDFGRELSERIGKNELRGIFEESIYFLSSFFNGLPASLLSFIADYKKLLEKVDYFVKIYRECYEFSYSEGVLKINKRAHFSESFSVYLLSALLSEALNHFIVKNFSHIDVKKFSQQGVDLELLRELSNKIYRGESVYINRIEDELDRMKKYLEEKVLDEESEWIVYGEEISNLHERNFFAHAGLCFGIVVLKKQCNRILIKYSENQELLKQVKTYLREAIS